MVMCKGVMDEQYRVNITLSFILELQDHLTANLKLSLCLIKYKAIKTYGVEGYLHAFLTQALDGSEL
jgi:hypothetical protein